MALQELGQLHGAAGHLPGLGLLGLAREQIRVPVDHHRGARPGRHHHRVRPTEGLQRLPRHRAGLLGMPQLHPGCPQQVCARGITTSTPTRSSTVAAARDTDGAIASARHVRMSIARIA